MRDRALRAAVAGRVGVNLRRLRTDAGLSRDELADRVGARGPGLPDRHADPVGRGDGAPAGRAARRARLGPRSRDERNVHPQLKAIQSASKRPPS
jgi:transcriptional regulator with XRE-family HTH domain